MAAPWTGLLSGGIEGGRGPAIRRALLVGLGLALAVACGFAVTGESLHALVFVGVTAMLGLLALALTHPRAFFALLLPNTLLFPAIPLVEGRGANPIDLLLPIALVTTWLFAPRAPGGPPADAELAARRRDVVRAGLAYYAVALFSLALLAVRGGVGDALDSLLVLSRSIQAATFFYLVSRHARGRDGVLFVRNILFAAILLAAVVNLPAVAFYGVPRAGSVLIFGAPGARAAAAWSIGGLPVVMTNPNEMASACVLAWALLLGLPPRRGLQALGLVLSFLLLLATQSRSGLLAWVTFVLVYGSRAGRRKLLVLPLLAVAVVPFLPPDFQGRLLRTVLMQEGSFEAYTSIIRLFGWQAAVEIFRAHPLFGVGYLGFRHVAQDYNPLGLYLETAENFFLETAVGMGVLGLLALAGIAVACARLGRAARRRSEPGSLAHSMGTVTPAFLLAVAAGNMTGDNLIGLLNGAQFVIFFALLAATALEPACRRAGAGRS